MTEKEIEKLVEKAKEEILEYSKKIDEGTITKEDVPKLMKIVNYKTTFKRPQDSKSDYDWSDVDEFKEKLPKIKGVLAEYFGCSEEEIYCGDISEPVIAEYKAKSCKVVFGDVCHNHFPNSQRFDRERKVEIIVGSLDTFEMLLTSFAKLKYVGGDVNLKYFSNIINLGSVEEIGGSLYTDSSKLRDLGDLKRIGGNAHLKSTNLKSLGDLEYIGGYLEMCGSGIIDSEERDSFRFDPRIECPIVGQFYRCKIMGNYIYMPPKLTKVDWSPQKKRILEDEEIEKQKEIERQDKRDKIASLNKKIGEQEENIQKLKGKVKSLQEELDEETKEHE